MTAGMILLVTMLNPHPGDETDVAPLTYVMAGGGTAATIVALVVAAGRGGAMWRTACLGAAAGTSFGLTATLIKATIAQGDAHGLLGVLTTWPTYVAIACGVLGLVLVQWALHTGPLLAAQPGFTLMDPLVSILWGVLVFNELTRTGPWLVGATVGGIGVGIGVMLLARSPLLADARRPRARDDAFCRRRRAAVARGTSSSRCSSGGCLGGWARYGDHLDLAGRHRIPVGDLRCERLRVRSCWRSSSWPRRSASGPRYLRPAVARHRILRRVHDVLVRRRQRRSVVRAPASRQPRSSYVVASIVGGPRRRVGRDSSWDARSWAARRRNADADASPSRSLPVSVPCCGTPSTIAVQQRVRGGFPVGTLVVNVTGSFVLGSGDRPRAAPRPRHDTDADHRCRIRRRLHDAVDLGMGDAGAGRER